MATYKLDLTADQINRALSGAYFLLQDTWGFTGNLNLTGNAKIAHGHIERLEVGKNLYVTGNQTGFGYFKNLTYGEFNKVSITGDSFIKNITGIVGINSFYSETGRIKQITGDIFFNGSHFSKSGGSLSYTGESVIFKLDTIEDFSLFLDDGKILNSGFETFTNIGAGTRFHGGNHQFDGDMFVTGDLYVTGNSEFRGDSVFYGDSEIDGNLNVDGNITISGISITQPLNTLQLTGSLTDVFVASGDLLIGTGLSGATILPRGLVNQVLTVDDSVPYRLAWKSGALGAGGLTYFADNIDNLVNVSLAPISGHSSKANVGLQVSGNGGFWLSRNKALIPNIGTNSVDLQIDRGLAAYTNYGASSIIAGGTNNTLKGNYGFLVGRNNYVLDGDYQFVGGSYNQSSGHGTLMFGFRNIWNSIDINGSQVSNTSLLKNIYIGTDNSGSYDSTSPTHTVIGNSNSISGSYGCSIFGDSNKINLTGIQSSACMALGYLNNVESIRSFAFGYNNTNKSLYSIDLGNSNTIFESSDYSSTLGVANISRSSGSLLLGIGNESNTGVHNSIAMGYYSTVSRYGERAWSNTVSPCQVSDFMFYGVTTNNTPTEIFLAGVDNKRLTLASGEVLAGKFSVAAKTSTEMASYTVDLVAKNIGGTLTVQGTVTVIHEDDSSWDVTFTADNANKSIKATVTGATGKNITWAIKALTIDI